MNKFYPQFIIILRGDTVALALFNRTVCPTSSTMLDTPAGRPVCLLAGAAAEWLHLALAGHRCGADPAAASPDLARCARAYLMRHRREPGGYYLAHQVARSWAGFFSPGIHPRLERIRL